jgi:hypothetical protein
MIWASRVVCDTQTKKIFLILIRYRIRKNRICKKNESIIDVKKLKDVVIILLAIFSTTFIFFVIIIIFELMSFV